MRDRYPTLVFISDAIKSVSTLVFIAGTFGALIVLLSSKDIIAPLIILVSSIAGSLILFAIGGALQVLMDIEKNTRRPARKE
jgi:hypothetical protein